MPAMAASEESWRLCRELPFDLGPERSVPIRQERWACWERSNTHNCMQDPESTGDGAMAAEETWCGCTTAEVGQPDSFHLSKLDNLFNVFFHQVGQFCWEDKICYTKCSLRCVWWCSMNEWLWSGDARHFLKTGSQGWQDKDAKERSLPYGVTVILWIMDRCPFRHMSLEVVLKASFRGFICRQRNIWGSIHDLGEGWGRPGLRDGSGLGTQDVSFACELGSAWLVSHISIFKSWYGISFFANILFCLLILSFWVILYYAFSDNINDLILRPQRPAKSNLIWHNIIDMLFSVSLICKVHITEAPMLSYLSAFL